MKSPQQTGKARLIVLTTLSLTAILVSSVHATTGHPVVAPLADILPPPTYYVLGFGGVTLLFTCLRRLRQKK